MKKLVVVFASVLLFASCTQSKIGYVDVEEIMKEYDATKDVEAALKAEQEKVGKSLDSLSAAFQGKVQDFYKKAQRMSAKSRQAKEAELQQEQQALQAKGQQAQQALQQKSQEEIEKLTKKLDKAVAEYAKTNKFTMILGTQGNGTVMYGEDQTNLTETILDVLNEAYEEKE
ncbi:MAG: OmpH family outer membrane protein [Flavobacteriaceae bacterium]|nr:OmpH family outer membrane protein [Flavobacteriaceae bacterium]